MTLRDGRPKNRQAAPGHRSAAGFSIVEVMVAGVILAVIALGLIPLYSRSIRSNVEGFDYTQVSNFAKSRAEEYLQYPFGSAPLDVPDGSEELEVQDFYSAEKREWVTELPEDPDAALFERTTTIRQFRAAALDQPLDGSELADVLEITVRVEGTRVGGAMLGPGKTIAIRVLKSQ